MVGVCVCVCMRGRGGLVNRLDRHTIGMWGSSQHETAMPEPNELDQNQPSFIQLRLALILHLCPLMKHTMLTVFDALPTGLAVSWLPSLGGLLLLVLLQQLQLQQLQLWQRL